MKKTIFLLNTILCFIITISTQKIYSQVSTVDINYSQRQGAFKQCGLSSCTYFSGSGDEVLYSDGTGGASNTKNARYLFSHPGFTNNKIKKIILEIQISKIFNSTTLDAGMSIKIPDNSCNSAISWSGITNSESLFNCNNTGTSIFQDGIGTSNTSSTTFNLLIYDSGASGFPSQTLGYFDPNGTSFTFVFSPYVGGVTIQGAKVHITYENIVTVPLPATPTLTATSNSSSSVMLSWNNVSNASSYQIVDCNGQNVATTTATSYTVTGLLSSTSYSYKVKAINSAGSSAYSVCKSATTGSGGCSSNINNLTPSGVTNVTSSADGVLLEWNTLSYADAYEVFQCETGLPIAEVTSTEYFIPRSQLEPGKYYSYKVRGVDYCNNGGGLFSKFSNCYSLGDIPCQDWSFESNPFTYEVGDTWLRLYWSYLSLGNYLFEIYDCSTNQLIGTAYDDSYQLINLSPGTQYSFKIRSRGCTPPVYNDFSNCITITTLGCQSDVIIADKTFNGLVNYEASNSMTITNSTFEAGSSGVLKGANFIGIMPDTDYKSGSNIEIKIEECSYAAGRMDVDIVESEIQDENLIYEYKFAETKTVNFTTFIYPNPVKDLITIVSDKEFKNIVITSIDGKSVLNENVNGKLEVTLDLSTFEIGVYIISIEALNGETTIGKIIKK